MSQGMWPFLEAGSLQCVQPVRKEGLCRATPKNKSADSPREQQTDSVLE